MQTVLAMGGTEPESGWRLDEKGRWRQSGRPDAPSPADAASPPALAPGSPRVRELLPALVFHLAGEGAWLIALGFAALFSTASNRQFNEVALIGAGTWLVAAFLMVWLWRSGKPNTVTLWIPVAWWVPSFLWAISVVY
jgi:hypothetical protein